MDTYEKLEFGVFWILGVLITPLMLAIFVYMLFGANNYIDVFLYHKLIDPVFVQFGMVIGAILMPLPIYSVIIEERGRRL